MNLLRLILPPLALLATVTLRAAPPHPATVLVGAGAEALANEERAFARTAVEKGVVAAWTAYFAPEAVQLAANQAPVHGLPAITAWLQTVGMAAPGATLDWWPLHAEVAADGSLGYTFGEWEFRLKDAAADARPLTRGKFASVWKRQADGAWKVILDVGNEYPEPKS